MNKWAKAFRTVAATLIVLLLVSIVTVVVLMSDFTFQATASIGLKIEPVKKVAKPPMSDWMVLPQGDIYR